MTPIVESKSCIRTSSECHARRRERVAHTVDFEVDSGLADGGCGHALARDGRDRGIGATADMETAGAQFLVEDQADIHMARGGVTLFADVLIDQLGELAG